VSKPDLSGNQQHPSQRLAALDIFVGGRGLFEREFAIDHDLDISSRGVVDMALDIAARSPPAGLQDQATTLF
jgi:hypothetical protein